MQKRNSCIKLLICLILDKLNLAVRPHLFEFQVFNINFSMNADDIKLTDFVFSFTAMKMMSQRMFMLKKVMRRGKFGLSQVWRHPTLGVLVAGSKTTS
jgi:hypothetical protein